MNSPFCSSGVKILAKAFVLCKGYYIGKIKFPFIMLTAKGEENDRVLGFDLERTQRNTSRKGIIDDKLKSLQKMKSDVYTFLWVKL